MSNTSELTSLLDVEARSHGVGGKRLLHMVYLCCVMALLYQAATGTGFDAAAASVAYALPNLQSHLHTHPYILLQYILIIYIMSEYMLITGALLELLGWHWVAGSA